MIIEHGIGAEIVPWLHPEDRDSPAGLCVSADAFRHFV